MQPWGEDPRQARAGEIAAHEAELSGLELVSVELLTGGGRATLRLTIDRPGGVTLDHCASFSRQVGAALEVEDPIASPYDLEVSSPGLDRKLVRPEDYERFRGRQVRVRLGESLDGQRNFLGLLGGIEEGEILLTLEGGRQVRLPLARVRSARLVPEF
jgi:ribosome maturation factor RimP